MKTKQEIIKLAVTKVISTILKDFDTNAQKPNTVSLHTAINQFDLRSYYGKNYSPK